MTPAEALADAATTGSTATVIWSPDAPFPVAPRTGTIESLPGVPGGYLVRDLTRGTTFAFDAYDIADVIFE
ncbi:hypothetical protein HOU70_gp53 [Arthrobacter phage Liebe]|uniref:RNA binding protein n=2 Tax=Arthrobacter virus Liebe TaxID=2734245 RepID=A0A3G2KHT4_9CAUD|nr:hypothetical protein HOU70_gp53 [Arthrobacter phage Liebe]AYN58534.1 RNA binding protein [Arthrobacter phage Maureen]AZF93786.1 RNA binding protein [Arthrobacter phage Liebe]